jgi:hypothetical protein
MHMPEWVMLDCALLPSMFVGIEGPAHLIDPLQRCQLDVALATEGADKENSLSSVGFPQLSRHLANDEIVPLAEYCAIPCIGRTDTIVGYSLFALLLQKDGHRLRGLGTLTKAFGLAVHQLLGATIQIGVAQYDSRSLGVHTRFGDLRLREVLATLHTRTGTTFIYELSIPSKEHLRRIAESVLECDQVWPKSSHMCESPDASEVSPDDKARLCEMNDRHNRGTHRYRIVSPGYNQVKRISYIIEESEVVVS